MSLYKPKGSSLWYYDFWIKGVRYNGPTGTTNHADAKEVESAEREKVRRGLYFPDEKKKSAMTVKEAFHRYYEEVSSHLSSADNHLSYMAKLLVLGPDTKLSDITDTEVALLVARRRGDKARHRGHRVSNATVNRETELLARILRRAKKVWKADTGDEIDWRVHRLHEADERVRELGVAEERLLFAHLREDYHPLMRFALTTGMRLANIVGLTWRQIDLDAGQINIKMKSRKPGGRSHTLPITPGLRTLLLEQRGLHPVFVFTYECAKSRAGRIRGNRYPFSRNGWRKPWAAALQAAGIADFRFHDMRHTAATRIVRSTGNLKVAQKLLGHTDISTTTRYAHVTQDDVLNGLLAVESQNFPKASFDEPRKNQEKYI